MSELGKWLVANAGKVKTVSIDSEWITVCLKEQVYAVPAQVRTFWNKSQEVDPNAKQWCLLAGNLLLNGDVINFDLGEQAMDVYCRDDAGVDEEWFTYWPEMYAWVSKISPEIRVF